jgi:hypothetical protein
MPTSDLIRIQNARLSFPRLFKPKSFRPNQEARYESTFLLDPSNETHAAVIEEIEATALAILTEKYGEKIPKNIVYCFGTAEDLDKTYDGYEGQWLIATSTPISQPPTVIDRGRNELKANEDGVEPRIPYAGCFVNTNITLWVMDNEFGKRVNANLRIVQFVKDGEAFSTVVQADPDEMEELPEEETQEEEPDFLR